MAGLMKKAYSKGRVGNADVRLPVRDILRVVIRQIRQNETVFLHPPQVLMNNVMKPGKYMSFPILEFDPTAEAFIEPSKVIRPRDVPEHCVICFFKEVIEKSVDHIMKMLVRNAWEDGPHPIYEIEHQEGD